MKAMIRKRCVIYTRVSFSDQVEGFSLESQEKTCRDLAEKEGYEMVRVFCDKGISAKTIDDRPGLLNLLNFIKNKSNGIHAIVVYSSSRVSRDTKDWLFLRALFSKAGILMVSVTEPMISGNDPVSVFISTILGSINQFDNDLRSANVKRGMKSKFLEGLPTGKIPLGYVPVKDRHMPPTPDPVWFPILQTMWQRILSEKLSIGATVDALNKLELRTFSRQTVSGIFSDKFYAGVIHSRTYHEEVRGKHEPMISIEQFYGVREIFTNRKPESGLKRKKLRNDFRLKGLMLCTCGRHLTAGYSRGRSGTYPYYLCSSRSHPVINIPRDWLEEQVMELLKLIKPKPSRLAYYSRLIKEKYENRYKLEAASHEQLHREITNMDKALTAIRGKNARGIYTDEEYLDMKDQLMTEKAVKQIALNDHRFELVDIQEVINFMMYYLNHLDVVFLKASPEDRLKIAGSIFPEKIIVENGNIRTVTLGRQYYQIAAPKLASQKKYTFTPAVQTEAGDLVHDWISLFQSVSPSVYQYAYVGQ